jgi:hypothetical protein
MVSSQQDSASVRIEAAVDVVRELATKILPDAKKKAKNPQYTPLRIPAAKFQLLAQSNVPSQPSLHFVLGVACLYDMVDIEEDEVSSGVGCGPPECKCMRKTSIDQRKRTQADLL